MKKNILLMGLIWFMSGCSNPSPKNPKPTTLISVDTFSAIMADLYLAEAFGINERAHSFKETKDQVYPYYKEILDKYGISKPSFDSSYHYYEYEPEIMLKILDKARLDLEDQKKKLLDQKSPNEQ